MSFKNFLDLRKKVQPQVQIIERIILQKRSWKSDLILTLSVIFVASGVIWGITKADTVIQAISRSQVKNFSVVGIVSNIDATNIYLEQAKGSDDQGKTIYTLDLSSVTKVETNQYVAITLSDIKVGDKVVIQGKEDGGNISVKRIISFGLVIPKDETATTTEAVATTTPANLDGEDLKGQAATTTDEVVASTTPTDSPTIIETITEAVSNVIDLITGSSTASTTTDETEEATSTQTNIPEQDLNEQATGTPTTPEPTATDTPSVIENVTNTITDVINDVTNAVGNAVQNVIETVTQTNLPEEDLTGQAGPNEQNQNPANSPPTE
jgi:hypothetical protein